MSISRNLYARYTPAQQELRAIAFSLSSEKVVGANYVAGWQQTDPRPTGFESHSRENYLPVDVRANLALNYHDEEAGWVSVPTQRSLKRRERAASRRKEREATGGWFGRGEDSTLISPSLPLRADWALRKDGSHELVIR